jgi:glycosyltransferase involved in cell wall biosynthesis
VPASLSHDSAAPFTPGPESCELSVVVPVYNEEECIAALDAEIREALRSSGRTAEIIYVDDFSRDRSRAVLNDLAQRAAGDPIRTRVVLLRRNYGQTSAMAAGFELAAGRVVFPLDADRQNNPADIVRLLEIYEQGYDCVSGWRLHRRDKSLSRKLPSMVANWLIGRVSGVKLHDYGCTLKAYNGALLKELNLYGEMHRFIPLYLARLGARITELPVDHRPRTTGVSKYGGRRIFKVVLDLLLIRFMTRYYSRPMHFFGQAAILFAALVAASAALMVIFKYGWLRYIGIDYQATFIQTPLPIVASMFFVGGVTSAFFGILAEVLMRVYHEVQDIRPYRIESIVDSRGYPTG